MGGGPCAAAYPDALELRPDGRYTGRSHPSAKLHPRWDVGGWQVTAPGRIVISTSNGADVAYRFALDGNALHVTDQDGCRLEYRRDG